MSEQGMVKNVGIIGGGMMGMGIAIVCARAGLSVKCFIRRRPLEQPMQEAEAILRRLVKIQFIANSEADQALANIRWTRDFAEVIHDCDVAIETVPEELEVKLQVFEQMDSEAPPQAILTSDTTAIRITEIASNTRSPERVIGLHWMSPAYLIPAVEVIYGEKTSLVTIRRAQKFVLQLGQVPCVAKDIPGFVSARFRTVVLNEAVRFVEQGVASVEDIDNLARFRFVIQLLPHGPLRSLELTAPKSLAAKVGDFIYSKTGEEKYRAPKLLLDKARTGELPWVPGEPKTTKGFYDYSGQDPEAVMEKRDLRIGKTVRFLEEMGIIEEERQRIRATIERKQL
jgi:3-hydroxybutyryl-CoA dehydrogenase